MAEGLLPFLLFVVAPFVLPWVFAVLRGIYNWRRHVVFLRPISGAERLVLLTLAAFACSQMWLSMAPAQSYFSLTKTPVDSPAYMIRNRFREYVAEQEAASESFRVMTRERGTALRAQANGNNIIDPDAYDKTYSSQVDIELPFIALERLSNELRLGEFRKRYTTFGADAADCVLCKSQKGQSFSLVPFFVLPALLGWYLAAALLVGLATSFDGKTGVRAMATMFLCMGIFAEVATLFMSESASFLPAQLLMPAKMLRFATRPEQMALFRHVLLAFVAMAVLLIDVGGNESPLLKTIRTTTTFVESSIARLQTSRLARMASQRDDTLRRHYQECQKRELQESQQMFSDPEYKALHADFSRKYRLEHLEKASEDSIKSAMDIILPSE